MSTIKEIRFPGVKDGETFKIGDIELIKFPGMDGMTPVVMKDIAFVSSFGSNNNLKESDILKRMKAEILPKVTAEIGAENICTFKTDLTTLDGIKVYGVMESQISLVTLDFYRANVDIFDKYKVDRWWWLATADSAPPHCNAICDLCVSRSGRIDYFKCNYGVGVRPFLILNSSIFESSED